MADKAVVFGFYTLNLSGFDFRDFPPNDWLYRFKVVTSHIVMVKNVFSPLFRWLFANAILPIVVPVVILIIGNELAVCPTHKYWDTIQKLVLEGFYILSSMTLFFSLLENYKEFKEASSSAWLLMMSWPMAIICIIFYQTEQIGLAYFQTHKTMFIGSWLILIAYATFLKYKILKYKYTYRYGR